MTFDYDECPPHIKLESALSVHGSELIQAAGRIREISRCVSAGGQEFEAAAMSDVIRDVQYALRKIETRITEYAAASKMAEAAE